MSQSAIDKANLKQLAPIVLPPGKKAFWASDFHLGTPNHKDSRTRENLIVQWLESIQDEAEVIFLVGDIFDFWFEYKNLIPKGFIRFQGKLAEIIDSGTTVYLFTGNHDMWMFDYFEEELGLKPIREDVEITINNHLFAIGHGDGVGPGDLTYKFLKAFFKNKLCQFLFSILPNRLSFGIANGWSRSSRKSHGDNDKTFHGELENQIIYSRSLEKTKHRDYYIFGHRHILKKHSINEQSEFINLGDWISHNSYAEFDGEELNLLRF